tara:strand:+ start:1226 stop:2362 length:1137 start_codon:yes stop_codon:yes gene_type:complete
MYYLGKDVKIYLTTETDDASVKVLQIGDNAQPTVSTSDGTYANGFFAHKLAAASLTTAGYEVPDLTGVDLGLGAVDEDISYIGRSAVVKAEMKKETTITLTKKKNNSVFDAVYCTAVGRATTTLTVTDGDAAVGVAEDAALTLISTDGTTKKYSITNAASDDTTVTGTILSDSGNTDTGAGTAEAGQDNAIAVSINLSSGTQHDLLTELKTAIEGTTGHAGKILVSAVPASADGNLSIVLTQAVPGTDGNTARTSASMDTLSSANFTGGTGTGAGDDDVGPRWGVYYDGANYVFNNGRADPEDAIDSSASSVKTFGYRVHIKLSSGQWMSIPGCQMTEHTMSINGDGTSDETIGFTSHVTPLIGTTTGDVSRLAATDL